MSACINVRFFIGIAAACTLGACAANFPIDRQRSESFCTAENGYQQGLQGARYTGTCPDVLAPTFLEGYQNGYAVYLAQLEIDAMERAIETMSKDLEQVSAARTAAQTKAERSTDAPERLRWSGEARQLTDNEHALATELDELESEIAFRKTQLEQMRHTVAAND